MPIFTMFNGKLSEVRLQRATMRVKSRKDCEKDVVPGFNTTYKLCSADIDNGKY